MWIIVTLHERFPVDAYGPFASEGDAEAWAVSQHLEEAEYVALLLTGMP